jgi:hypothetical protein
MNEMQTSRALRAVRNELGVQILGSTAGPVPTISVDAGEHIIVEVDPTDITAPVTVDVTSLEAADTDLRDLLGSAAVNQLHAAGPGNSVLLDFVATRSWEGLAALASQLWNERWNVFPLDPAFMAVDRLAAAAAAGPFGTSIARESLPKATGVLAELRARQEHGQLVPAAAAAVDTALLITRGALPAREATSLSPLPDQGADLPMLLESRVATFTSAALHAGATLSSQGGPVTSLFGTADWRLTGLGMASTAEDMVRAEYADRREDLVRISVPAQEPIPTDGRADEPYYQGIVTDALSGEVLAFVHMALNPEGTRFEGIGSLARPFTLTDIVDIRHPMVNEPVQKDPKRRQLDRVRRAAARAHAAERLATAVKGGNSASVDVLAAAWGHVVRETSLLEKDYPQFRSTLPGWIGFAKAHRRRAFESSAMHWQQLKARTIDIAGLPDLAGRLVQPPALGELDFTGALYRSSGQVAL